MASIGNVSGSVIAQAYAAEQAIQAESRQTGSQQSSGDAFGNAVNVTLSAPAQAIVAGQAPANASSSSGSASANAPPPPAPPPPAPHSPGVPVTTSSTTADEETLVEEALREVIPKVGVTGASEVVDSKGDIDQAKLQELIARQDQPKSS